MPGFTARQKVIGMLSVSCVGTSRRNRSKAIPCSPHPIAPRTSNAMASRVSIFRMLRKSSRRWRARGSPGDGVLWQGEGVPSLILTADDFGRSPAVNAAIGDWARAGALTCASLMVHESAAEDAMRMARDFPELSVGLHLTLCDGLAHNGSALPRTPARAGMRYAFWPGARAQLREEIEAQFARFVALGLPPAYWDGHTHLHLHPTVLAIALPIAVRHGFRRMRLVQEPGPPALLPAIFRTLSRRAARQLTAHHIASTEVTIGLRHTGRVSKEDFQVAMKHAQQGPTELYFHPGADPHLPDPQWVAAELRQRGLV
jgi:chitin disaccharide deacetylase